MTYVAVEKRYELHLRAFPLAPERIQEYARSLEQDNPASSRGNGWIQYPLPDEGTFLDILEEDPLNLAALKNTVRNDYNCEDFSWRIVSTTGEVCLQVG